MNKEDQVHGTLFGITSLCIYARDHASTFYASRVSLRTTPIYSCLVIRGSQFAQGSTEASHHAHAFYLVIFSFILSASPFASSTTCLPSSLSCAAPLLALSSNDFSLPPPLSWMSASHLLVASWEIMSGPLTTSNAGTERAASIVPQN